MIFYCSTCDAFYNEEEMEGLTADLTDVPCPNCSMPMNVISNDGPYDTLEEKSL